MVHLEAVGRIAGGLASHTLYRRWWPLGSILQSTRKYRLFGLVSTVANHLELSFLPNRASIVFILLRYRSPTDFFEGKDRFRNCIFEGIYQTRAWNRLPKPGLKACWCIVFNFVIFTKNKENILAKRPTIPCYLDIFSFLSKWLEILLIVGKDDGITVGQRTWSLITIRSFWFVEDTGCRWNLRFAGRKLQVYFGQIVIQGILIGCFRLGTVFPFVVSKKWIIALNGLSESIWQLSFCLMFVLVGTDCREQGSRVLLTGVTIIGNMLLLNFAVFRPFFLGSVDTENVIASKRLFQDLSQAG